MTYIIRDHDRARFERKKQVVVECGGFIDSKYGPGTATVVVKDQYFNLLGQPITSPGVVPVAILVTTLANGGYTSRKVAVVH